MLSKAVIPAAGMGTRLLPFTKEIPKEMLPIFVRGGDGEVYLKPVLQAIYEQLYHSGFREFCFIVGRGKRAIEDHFTPDYGYVRLLRAKNKHSYADELERFYKVVEDSVIVWITQPEPRGFGEAVLRARPFIGGEPFLVQAGDTYVFSKENRYLERMWGVFRDRCADAVFLVHEADDPRMYGVIEPSPSRGCSDVLEVEKMVEKPEKPPSNLAVIPVYMFTPAILDALSELPSEGCGELQLTDGIQRLIDRGSRVYAVKIGPDEERIDVGNSKTLWDGLRISWKYSNFEHSGDV